MNKDWGFLRVPRKDPDYRPKEERLGDSLFVEQPLSDRDIVAQSSRCMDCGTPFCHGSGCPLNNVIPEFNNQVFKGEWESALKILLSTSPFPEFTGRVCPALCEGSCVVGMDGDPVTVRQIELAIVEMGFRNGLLVPKPPSARHGHRVAVVGSGPAGLAAANVLNREGFEVRVFERDKYPGGILRYGIPDFKLEKWVVKRRIEWMEAEGICFETGVEIGLDMSLDYLRSRYDAILLACGARKPRDLNIPGRELSGIEYAMDFLSQQNRRLGGEFIDPRDEILATNKRVVVIGGGDTGSDCLGTALRQRAKSVLQLEILPEPPPTRHESTPWPMWPHVLRESSSHKEGGERRFSTMTEAFDGDEFGNVTALHCKEVRWETSKEGRMSPSAIDGSEFVVEADLVLLAMGFDGAGIAAENIGLPEGMDNRGFVQSGENNMTGMKGVFVAGDVRNGPSLVVHAIADGERAAHGIIKYLDNRSN